MIQAKHTNVKGRGRYRVDGLYRHESLKQYLEVQLSKQPGVISARANTLTSNILIVFSPDIIHVKIQYIIKKIVINYTRNQVKSQPKKAIIDKSLSQKASTELENQTIEDSHLQEADSVVQLLNTSKISGLSNELAFENLNKYGQNILPESASRSELSILTEQFQSLPVALLTGAAAVSIATGGLVDALVIMGVVAINAGIGYFTESQSEKIIHSLKKRERPSTLVIRGACTEEIRTENIVPGDILVLKPGSYVAADARLIETENLSIDESALTGESIPVTKTTTSLCGHDIPLADRINMVYKGTLVTGGQGIAAVVGTGKFTELGKIQKLVGEASATDTPLARQLDQVGSQLVVLSSVICGAVFALGLLRGYPWLSMLKTSISLAVAAVPEGLPTVATTTLALGIRDMRQHQVLVRSLNAVEALGSVQKICLDKTGTITENRMSVVEIRANAQILQVSNGNLINGEKIINPYVCEELLKLIHILVLCNESEVVQQSNEKYVVKGSATENALIYMATAAGVEINSLRENYPLIATNQRSENRNIMSTLHKTPHNYKLVALKGRPTEILNLCNSQMKDGQVVPLTEEDKLTIEIENERMAGRTLRVLAAAYTHVETSSEISVTENLEQKLTWLGLIGMTDPVRKGVKDLMAQFHQAGIDTVMITGDQSPTAFAIAKELELANHNQLQILDSTDLLSINPDAKTAIFDKVNVFARISPANKLQIVQSLQAAGRVVAMTGDGINDAPALKAANVGVAMGSSGTDAAREVADIIIADDNLETMIIAVSRGRTIYNNIRKSVHFLLSTNLSEIIVMLVATVVGMGQPLNAIQLLWLNLVTDIFPGLALALEPMEPDVLSKPPRNPNEPIIKTSDFNGKTCSILTSLKELPPNNTHSFDEKKLSEEEIEQITVRNQVTVFGFACNQTPAFMPLPIWLAHKLARQLTAVKLAKTLTYLSPDGKTQVGIEYKNRKPYRIHSISVIASQNSSAKPNFKQLDDDIRDAIIQPVFQNEEIQPDENTKIYIDFNEPFNVGGPSMHSGLTGRKNAIDTYGEYSRHSGSALSGKDPTRIDRIGAYVARYAAKNIVAASLASECEIQLSYSMGYSKPVSIQVETFGTGKLDDEEIVQILEKQFDFRLAGIIKQFNLRFLPSLRKDGFYEKLAAYGHVGRMDIRLPWEITDKVGLF